MPTGKRLLIARFFVLVHRVLFRLSGGRLLGRLDGQGVLILVTKGRRSGRRRSSRLLYFRFEESSGLIVVASNYGRARHPAWYLNLSADPHVNVETEGQAVRCPGSDNRGEERSALFAKVVAGNPRFATYRASASRRIPVIALHPRQRCGHPRDNAVE